MGKYIYIHTTGKFIVSRYKNPLREEERHIQAPTRKIRQMIDVDVPQ
jgi:hypothetical protein